MTTSADDPDQFPDDEAYDEAEEFKAALLAALDDPQVTEALRAAVFRKDQAARQRNPAAPQVTTTAGAASWKRQAAGGRVRG